ncbi:hypothetical protein KPL47_15180 [Clostridium estertheticum]|uniref:TetR/AcrR family transcriptional regulator n=1 Tax=Clostridium estertheticum TaxID=238834 RepID=UPI001C0BAC1E|nr:TetR/AcrR family transcriptional regulator [Clostridium estertheticum]MBU3177673.1 hypothetical protein [Clostridium estertheticum]
MYIKSENLQALQSQQMITDALLSLMNSYQYNDITITQICQEAQVVRQTFYRNFEFKTDILEFYLDSIFKKFISNPLNSQADMYNKIKSFFDYMFIHKNFLILIEKNNIFFLLNKTLTTNISKFSYVPKIIGILKEPKLDVYVLGYISSTICSILSLWVKNDFEESTEMLSNLLKIFFAGLEKSDLLL